MPAGHRQSSKLGQIRHFSICFQHNKILDICFLKRNETSQREVIQIEKQNQKNQNKLLYMILRKETNNVNYSSITTIKTYGFYIC